MINVIKVKGRDEGNLKAHDLLKDLVDNRTLLALSGGTSPDYRKMIVEHADILPGAVCMVDERFGVLKEESNEYKLREESVTDFLESKNIAFYKILRGKGFGETAKDYDGQIRDLFAKFPKKVGIMGVGENLHTAGLFPNSEAMHWPHYVVHETVVDQFRQRISLSLKALGEFDNFVILVFGSAKRNVLKLLLDEDENNMQKYPAIFYRKCKAHCWLITDIAI